MISSLVIYLKTESSCSDFFISSKSLLPELGGFYSGNNQPKQKLAIDYILFYVKRTHLFLSNTLSINLQYILVKFKIIRVSGILIFLNGSVMVIKSWLYSKLLSHTISRISTINLEGLPYSLMLASYYIARMNRKDML